jgi:IS66 C-terminal element
VISLPPGTKVYLASKPVSMRLNPQVWLADVLDRIGRGHPINRMDELLPWNWVDPEARSYEVA